ncbi:MAG: hypothetical protein FWF66_03965 [Candidatus Bathyarchaeota archaeon]|nr:hypothetical protein [Candidatus Termiticorpusculum sp.]
MDIMKDKQLVYLDVISRGYTYFDGGDTVVSLMDNQVIYHLELINSGDGFVFDDSDLFEQYRFGSSELYF